MRWYIFCQIIDNYGDAGVCWRLARSLSSMHQQTVRIFCDNLPTLNLLASGVEASIREKIALLPWESSSRQDLNPGESPDVVIEAFGCMLPQKYLTHLLITPKKPLIINLEYLSAEPWILDFHGKASPQSHGLPKYFFFPGFQAKAGGILLDPIPSESTISASNIPPSLHTVWSQLRSQSKKISVFCYSSAPLGKWLADLNALGEDVDVILTYGQIEQLELASGLPLKLHPHVQLLSIPFVSQDEYDWLLAQCDFNIVRGEDSFVRAQLAGKPFIWHIYPQSDQAHEVKLTAFLELYLASAHADLKIACNDAMHWKSPSAWLPAMALWNKHAQTWRTQLLQNQADGGLAARLISFVA